MRQPTPRPEAPLATMPGTRRAILVALKRQGEMTAGQLSDQLDLTSAAVRSQLSRLAEDGLVWHTSGGSGRGRPVHLYRLAPAAETLFPKRYGDLAAELLGYLGGPDSDAVGQLFDHRAHRRLVDASKAMSDTSARTGDGSLAKKVAELTRILDDDGYLADVQTLDGGGWLITEHNCAILSVAQGFSQACSSELSFIRHALPEAQVDRVAHLMDGAHVCA
ncbi:MAG: helix-turn-helix transcriptional regulator, partial [Acidimicrobiales bacterium]